MASSKQRAFVHNGGTTPRKLAVTADEAAELLHVSPAMVELLCSTVQPYIAAGGVQKWPLRELARVLADCGKITSPVGPGHG